jgi:hypothetical protein
MLAGILKNYEQKSNIGKVEREVKGGAGSG